VKFFMGFPTGLTSKGEGVYRGKNQRLAGGRGRRVLDLPIIAAGRVGCL